MVAIGREDEAGRTHDVVAHAKLLEQLNDEGKLPDYFKDHPVYYAGPAKTPKGMASGSFGPTTAGRMDSYVPTFQAAGGSMVMLAKGNRSRIVRDSCKQHGGFYLGSIGGPAANLGNTGLSDNGADNINNSGYHPNSYFVSAADLAAAFASATPSSPAAAAALVTRGTQTRNLPRRDESERRRTRETHARTGRRRLLIKSAPSRAGWAARPPHLLPAPGR